MASISARSKGDKLYRSRFLNGRREFSAFLTGNRYGTEARLRQPSSYPQAYSPAAAGYNYITHGSG